MQGRWRALTGPISMLSLLLGCARESPTGIVVEVDTDLEIPGAVDALRIRVREDDRVVHDLAVKLTGGGPDAKLPGRLALRPDDPADSSAVTVEATALLGDRELLHHQAQVRFRRGEVLLLRLPLLAECLCQVCAAGQTCERGPRCVPQAQDADLLPRYQPRQEPAGAAAHPVPARCAPPDAGKEEGEPDAFTSTDAGEPPSDLRARMPDAGVDRPATGADAGRDAAASDAPTPDAPPLLGPGAPCALGDRCASGSCADGVCCDQRCGSLCRACTRARTGVADGTCAPIMAGTDPRGDCAADAPGSCRYDGTCDGAGACRLYAPDTLCGSPSCSGGNYLAAARCNGSGGCAQPPARPCGLFACALDQGCLATCQSDGQCVAGAYCGAPACAPKKANGQACVEARECLSGMCPGNHCVGN